MTKDKQTKPDISPPSPPEPEQVSGCVVCGQYGGLVPVAGSASAHEACAAARPDVIAKVKARA